LLTITELAKHLNGVWHGNANHAISNISSLSRARSKDLTYFDNIIFQDLLESTSAGVVLLKPEHLLLCPVNSIVVSNPSEAMNHSLQYLKPSSKYISEIHPSAQIDPTAQLGTGVSVGANTVIAATVQIANDVRIGANSFIGTGVQIDASTEIGFGVVIHEGCRIGRNVVINSGCIIGASPFNYLKQHGSWQQGPVVGGVIISNGVHLGANTVIDKGSLGDTYLAHGVCIDNLVQIAHDVIIGPNTAIAGCAAVGAQAQIGADCIIGGASCIAAHVQLANDVVITGMSTVSKSITKAGIYSSGTLAHEHQRWRRNAARFRRLDDYIMKLSSLEKKIE
jgi:UDP-3-O-[3-hydroxymyristoyl] glucosamine N-acyltransferase